jgi:tRNA pseudouridine38-40 synthase
MHSEIGTAALVRALNASLPRDIRILQAQEATSDFNARRTVKSKHYQYRIIIGDSISPFEYRYAWHVTQNLDCSAMRAAGALLEGEHDFAAFQAAGSSVKTTLRRILRLEISRCSLGDRTIDPFPVVDGSLVTIDVEGTGFLRHMVRIIVGTLVDIGTGRRPPESIKHIIQNCDRSEAGPTAPARGLFLVKVNY